MHEVADTVRTANKHTADTKQQQRVVVGGPSVAKNRIMVSQDALWLAPTSIRDLVSAKQTYDQNHIPTRLVSGNTAQGVAKYYLPIAGDDPLVYIDTADVADLAAFKLDGNKVTIGANITLAKLITELTAMRAAAKRTESGDMCVPQALIDHLGKIANNQVRHCGSWCGNVMLCKSHPDFPSDVVLLWSALGASVSVTGVNGDVASMSMPDFLEYTMKHGDVVTACVLDFTQNAVVNDDFNSYKIMMRSQNSHCLINAAFGTSLSGDGLQFKNVSVLFGNLQRGPRSCPKTESFLKNNTTTLDTIQQAMDILAVECVPDSPPSGATWVVVDAAYRTSLACNLLFKHLLQFVTDAPVESTSASQNLSAIRGLSKGKLSYGDNPATSPVGDFIPKIEGVQQCSGEVKYTDDMPTQIDELHGAWVVSSIAKGGITSIDVSEASQLAGWHRWIDASTLMKHGIPNITDSELPMFADGACSVCDVNIGFCFVRMYVRMNECLRVCVPISIIGCSLCVCSTNRQGALLWTAHRHGCLRHASTSRTCRETRNSGVQGRNAHHWDRRRH
jgi:xanthine dehydrogenase iron-sulfur cluster and FAD-binding subunit A